MTWYDPRTWSTKANRAQEIIYRDEGTLLGSDASIAYGQAFSRLEAVNRGINMIVSACASLDFDVKDKIHDGVFVGIRKAELIKLLNFRPNPYQSAQDLRINMFTDFILEGNVFLHFDGKFLYHLPADRVDIRTDEKTFVSGYTYGGTIEFTPSEIIHFKDLSSTSIYRGSSRLEAADRCIKIQYQMQKFQEDFFKNGAITGLIFTTENTLSTIAKEKTMQYWASRYSPNTGARKPLILDSGLKVNPISNMTFKDLDFDTGIKTHDIKILKALGVPPLLLDGGNNANISPNLRLFYLETIIPIVTKFVSAIERYTGYDVSPVTTNVSALQPELKDVAAYYTTLVNGGVITPNEARVELRYAKVTDAEADKLRVPANIAGSAANPSEGGKPPGEEK